MTPLLLVIASLVGAAAYLVSDNRPVQAGMRLSALRLRAARPGVSNDGDAGRAIARGSENKPKLALLSCLLCGGVVWLLLGGIPGLVGGMAIAVGGPRLLSRFESRSSRADRLLIEAAAPMVADLMAACLASGASTAAATRATAEALGGPVSEVLNQCVLQFNLGAGPTQVWRPLTAQPSLAPIARAILRSAETGAPLTAVLLRVSDDLRLARRTQLEQAAKTVGVKAVGPLGLCFLPAFMLLGVVPLIASLISAGLPG